VGLDTDAPCSCNRATACCTIGLIITKNRSPGSSRKRKTAQPAWQPKLGGLICHLGDVFRRITPALIFPNRRTTRTVGRACTVGQPVVTKSIRPLVMHRSANDGRYPHARHRGRMRQTQYPASSRACSTGRSSGRPPTRSIATCQKRHLPVSQKSRRRTTLIDQNRSQWPEQRDQWDGQHDNDNGEW
jgi:hypothetical protein